MNEQHTTTYDYKKQAWIVDGKFAACGHPPEMRCECYGRVHEGRMAVASATIAAAAKTKGESA